MADSRQRQRGQEQSGSYISSLIRWLQLKNYQYEVTSSLYMLTPTEKIIFNLILFVLISMLIVAATMYLPNHVVTICNRVWYYYHGDNFPTDKGLLKGTVAASGSSVLETAESVMRHLNEL